MQTLHLEAVVQVVTIVGGVATLLLAAFQLADTWLDIGAKLHKRRQAQKREHASTRKRER